VLPPKEDVPIIADEDAADEQAGVTVADEAE
jgi:hypothetical protein